MRRMTRRSTCHDRGGSPNRGAQRRMRLARLLAPSLALGMAATLVGTGAISSASTKAKSTGVVKVGILASFSGTVPYGIDWLQGAQVAKAYIEANGGIMGEKISLIPEDEAADPVDAVTVGRKMLALDHPNLVLGLAVLDWRDVMPILESAHMVTFTQIADPFLDTHYLPYSFAADASDALEGTAMVRYCQIKGYKRVALVFDEESNAQTLLPAIKAAAKVAHISIVADPTLPVGVPSYEAEVQQIANAKPQALLTQVAPNTAGTFFPELANTGFKSVPLVGSDSTLEPQFVTAAVSLGLEKNLVSVEAYSSIASTGGHIFISGFKKLFHTTNYNVRSTYAYDGLTVAALAMTMAHSTNPAVYVKDILKVTTPGPGVTDVYSYKQGVQLLKQGKRIKYVGVGSNMTYNHFHRVSGAYEVAKLVNNVPAQLLIIPADSVSKLLK